MLRVRRDLSRLGEQLRDGGVDAIGRLAEMARTRFEIADDRSDRTMGVGALPRRRLVDDDRGEEWMHESDAPRHVLDDAFRSGLVEGTLDERCVAMRIGNEPDGRSGRAVPR